MARDLNLSPDVFPLASPRLYTSMHDVAAFLALRATRPSLAGHELRSDTSCFTDRVQCVRIPPEANLLAQTSGCAKLLDRARASVQLHVLLGASEPRPCHAGTACVCSTHSRICHPAHPVVALILAHSDARLLLARTQRTPQHSRSRTRRGLTAGDHRGGKVTSSTRHYAPLTSLIPGSALRARSHSQRSTAFHSIRTLCTAIIRVKGARACGDMTGAQLMCSRARARPGVSGTALGGPVLA